MEQTHWPTLVILAICFVAGGLAAASAPELFSQAASEIVTFSTLMSAGAMSAVVLVPTLMSHRFGDASIRKSVRDFAEYHGALWMGAFGVAATLAVIVIFGEVVRWDLSFSWRIKGTEHVFNFARVLNGLVGFLFSYLVFRIFFLAGAIQDLLRSLFTEVPVVDNSSECGLDNEDLPVDEEHGKVVDYGKE
ncbi:MAG: hypothetical protein IPK75_02995 [Acidobacteria bacterium]|nr:hypothetical protein [Acidobacteriota bacterium]